MPYIPEPDHNWVIKIDRFINIDLLQNNFSRYCQKLHEKPAHRMSIDRHLQGKIRGEKEVWEMKKSFFISAGFASAKKGRCQSALSRRRHVGNVQVWMGCKPCRL